MTSNQIGGNHNAPSQTTQKTLYCLPGATPAANQTVYEVSTYTDGVLNTTDFPTVYQNETGDVLTLTPAQIASLIPGGCNTDYEFISEYVCASGVTLERRRVIVNGVPSGVVVFYNPATDAAVAAPATFTEGTCPDPKVPATTFVDGPALTTALSAELAPAPTYREVVAYNRSNKDVIMTWAGTTGGAGVLKIPARGTEHLSLSIEPNEAFLSSVKLSTVTGTIAAYADGTGVFLNFKN